MSVFTETPTISELLLNYILPGRLMIWSLSYFVRIAISAPKLLLFDFDAYRKLAFAKFFAKLGENDELPPQIDRALESSHGVILDVGPGVGYQLYRFTHPENIKIIYGAEPGTDMHAELQEQARRAGLKYEVIGCGAEQESLIPGLAKKGLLQKNKSGNGIFDEIVCIRVLCGVPALQETVDGLYRLLKPGGRFVVMEHVVNKRSWIAWSLQKMYMLLGWRAMLGNCNLDRDTEAVLMRAAKPDGGWAEVKLDQVKTWATIPHVVGYLTKKK